MNNPYTDVDWQRALRVPSATHMHLMSQANLENAYGYGIRHFPISNYRKPPRKPTHSCVG